MNLTTADIEARGFRIVGNRAIRTASPPPAGIPSPAKKSPVASPQTREGPAARLAQLPKAKGVRREPGVMNKTEARYAEHLRMMQASGLIAWWGFEPVKLRLAKATFYTPDFAVMKNDGCIVFEEIKGGFWRDDARVKIKVAAEAFPMFAFVAVKERAKKNGGGWEREEF